MLYHECTSVTSINLSCNACYIPIGSKCHENRNNLSNCKIQVKVVKLSHSRPIALDATINWRAKLASAKLQHADFVHNLLIVMAVMQITAMAKSHGIHDDHDSMIFLQP